MQRVPRIRQFWQLPGAHFHPDGERTLKTNKPIGQAHAMGCYGRRKPRTVTKLQAFLPHSARAPLPGYRDLPWNSPRQAELLSKVTLPYIRLIVKKEMWRTGILRSELELENGQFQKNSFCTMVVMLQFCLPLQSWQCSFAPQRSKRDRWVQRNAWSQTLRQGNRPTVRSFGCL